MLDPRHIRVLIEVAKHKSYAGAARALGYTQPAIGQQIKSLERHLRIPVVYRSGRQVLLTEAGKLLVEHGKRMLDMMQAIEDDVGAVVGAQRGSVRLRLTATQLQLLAPMALTLLKQSRPGV